MRKFISKLKVFVSCDLTVSIATFCSMFSSIVFLLTSSLAFSCDDSFPVPVIGFFICLSLSFGCFVSSVGYFFFSNHAEGHHNQKSPHQKSPQGKGASGENRKVCPLEQPERKTQRRRS